MPIIKRAGYDIYECEMGEGVRRGLLLHCSLAHSGVWRGLAGLLGGEFAFTAYDHLSHGRSADWDRSGDYHSANTEVAHSFLQEPVDLIGHSFGATVALRLALEAPEKVRSLVMIEPVFFAVALADAPEYAEAHRAQVAYMSELIESGQRETAAAAFLSEWGGGGPPWEMMPQEMRDAMAARINTVSEAEPQLYYDSAEMLAEGRPQALDIPVLLIRGSLSPRVTQVINEGLERRIRGAQTVTIEGAGHMAPITHAKACAAEIRRFYGL